MDFWQALGLPTPTQHHYGALAEQLRLERSTAPLTDEMFDLLREGKATVADWNNALSGHGYNVGALTAKGLMRRVGERFIEGYRYTDYEITDVGRAALSSPTGEG